MVTFRSSFLIPLLAPNDLSEKKMRNLHDMQDTNRARMIAYSSAMSGVSFMDHDKVEEREKYTQVGGSGIIK
jgi:hypothetical protein